ncbi:MAG: hypothetical protein EBS55_10180 [Flavobacteriaceae bacterium]|nr:hypothetical protein [Flavobacteriaceae bacterium]
MGKVSSKGKYVVKVNNHDIYVLATKKPDTTKKHGYSMTFDFRIYKNGKLVEKGLKSKEAAVEKALTIVPKKQKS